MTQSNLINQPHTLLPNHRPPTPIQPKSILLTMSDRYGMEPAAFEATVRATCMRPDKEGRVPSREEFAAFLLVAKEYNLNPITREIYAFPAKGGGIVPIVSIDGWVNLVNSHGQCDGFDFEMEHDGNNNLVSCTCRIYRKDRNHPVVVTEYLSECIRETIPWKMKHRMLRHKAMIQAARYAFGFSGVYDEDEGRAIAEARDINPVRVPSPSEIIEADEEEIATLGGTSPDYGTVTLGNGAGEPSPTNMPKDCPNPVKDPEAFLAWVDKRLASISDPDYLPILYAAEIEPAAYDLMKPDQNELQAILGRHEDRLGISP